MENNIDFNKADEYLNKHYFNENWSNLNVDKRKSLLKYAETMLKSAFTFRGGAFETDNFFHAVAEQAIHLSNYEKERLQAIQQGVTYFMVDGLAFNLKDNQISPVARGFLRAITKAKVGDVI